ncbi:hypothetical protein Tco_1320563 [Tanacetum coccineum]
MQSIGVRSKVCVIKHIPSFDSATDLEDCSDKSSESSVPRETSLRDDDIAQGVLERGLVARVVGETVARRRGPETSVLGTMVIEKHSEGSVGNDSLRGKLILRCQKSYPSFSIGVACSERDEADLAFAILWSCVDWTMPNTRSRATITHETVNELISRRVAEALLNGNGNDDGNGGRNGNENGNGNGGGNGYENHNVNFGGFRPVARECTYQDFLKCQPLNFKGTEGVVGLTHWFDKIETVFHISNCPQKNQVKMVPDEEDKVERFIGALPDNIQGNVIAAEPTRLQKAIHIANNL